VLPRPIGQGGLPEPELVSSAVQIIAPRNAAVQIQGQAIEMENGQFVSSVSSLQPGKTYRYVVQAQMNQDGEVIKTSRQVTFQAGQQVRVDLRDTVAWERPERRQEQRPATGIARVSITAPEGVAIYLQGQQIPLREGRFSFTVTDLTPGKDYHYTFTAQAGQERVDKKVSFKAGNHVLVEFSRTGGLQASAR
jgi:uncharacterized protein (TIGR03000 family)